MSERNKESSMRPNVTLRMTYELAVQLLNTPKHNILKNLLKSKNKLTLPLKSTGEQLLEQVFSFQLSKKSLYVIFYFSLLLLLLLLLLLITVLDYYDSKLKSRYGNYDVIVSKTILKKTANIK